MSSLILKKDTLIPGKTSRLVIQAPHIAERTKPGNFVILRITENGERIPLTIAYSDPEAGTITIVYLVMGKTTALLETLKEGDSILDLCGPLGKPTHPPGDSGHRRSQPLPGQVFVLQTDLAIIAIGNGPNPVLLEATPEMILSKRGLISVDEYGETSIPNVFAGGDIVFGAAMGADRTAAKEIARRLGKGDDEELPEATDDYA